MYTQYGCFLIHILIVSSKYYTFYYLRFESKYHNHVAVREIITLFLIFLPKIQCAVLEY